MTMRPPVLVTAPAALPVTLVAAKQHLRVDHDDSDELITAYIEAATDHLDGYSGVLGRALINQTWRQDFDSFCSTMRLSLPASGIVSVAWRNEDGQMATVAADDYALQRDSTSVLVRFKDGYSFPSGLYQTEAVSITYTVGYGAAPEDVPAAIRAAIMLMVGDLYENRATVSERGSGRIDMSMTVNALVSPYRRHIV
ncbi:MAG: head-tail connector protein [Aurantimonas endophytica]|uniref:head-tail connector protein n=1 Tax=Aurantimonas endophytica TaxID=1522175 RepID=UPI003001E858